MSTVLAVIQQQSIEAETRSRERIRSTDRCPRCCGLMIAEWCQDLSDYTVQRCVQCGEIVDPVILRNRGAQQGNGDRFLLPIEVGAETPHGVPH